LTPVNGASGTEVLYATGVTSLTFDLSAANAGSVTPPKISLLPSSIFAAHAIMTEHTSSIAYLYPYPWTRKALHDWYRHYIKYHSYPQGSFGRRNVHVGYCNQYVALPSQPAGYKPYITAYEGGPVSAVPSAGAAAVVESGGYLTDRLNHDMEFDPDMYYTEMAHLQLTQQGSFERIHLYNLCMLTDSSGSADTLHSIFFGATSWSGMPAGRGDGSGITTPGSYLGAAGTAVTNKFWQDDGLAHHLDNASVRLQAQRDWIDVTSPINATPLRGLRMDRLIHGPTLWKLYA
jgi:hypothetical protein